MATGPNCEVSDSPPIYIINLDRSSERLARIAKELKDAGLPFRRVPAIDGRDLDLSVREYDEDASRRHYLARLSPGEIACVLSHREVWRLIQDGEEEAAVVLEDDAAFAGRRDELSQVVGEIARSPRPELVKLYNRSRPRCPAGNYRRRHPLLPALTTTAQALNRSAARALLAFTETFHEPADVIIQRWWDHGVRVTAMEPPLFAELGHGSNSTIRSASESPAEGRLLRELRRPLFQAGRLTRAISGRIRSR
jgi:glycosyl transferase family 25